MLRKWLGLFYVQPLNKKKCTNEHYTNNEIPKPTIIIQNNFIVAFYGAIWDWRGDKIIDKMNK